jgi:hypothetical protein
MTLSRSRRNAHFVNQMANVVPANCVVTGSTGFVGQRLVEMLIEYVVWVDFCGCDFSTCVLQFERRGAQKVKAFDIVAKPHDAIDDKRVEVAPPSERGRLLSCLFTCLCLTCVLVHFGRHSR